MPIRTETTDGLEQTYQYDSLNRILSYTTRVGANSLTTGFVYGDSSVYGNNLQKDGYLYGVTLNGERAVSYEFDILSRLVAQRLEAANNYKVRYEYYQGPNHAGTANTTTMLEAVVKEIPAGHIPMMKWEILPVSARMGLLWKVIPMTT